MPANPYESPATAELPPAGAEDSVLISARREALVAFGIWCLALAWTIGYCGIFAYDQDAEVKLILGVPSWVMWGVFAPWTICTIVSSLLAYYFIRDADLGEDPEEKTLGEIRGEHEAAREIGDV